jgi:hypothetical protein
MKRTLVLNVFLITTTCLSLFAVPQKDKAGNQTLTGVVSDAMCGAKHMMDGSPADCTRACVRQGSKYALVVGDKVYTLNGHSEELDKLAGQQATLVGTVHDDGRVDVVSVK